MEDKTGIGYIAVYLFTPISAVAGYFVSGDNNRLRFHSKQALVIGIIGDILFVFQITALHVLGILLWLCGAYLGFEAYKGRDVAIPGMQLPKKTSS